MNVLVTDPDVRMNTTLAGLSGLDELLSTSDIVVSTVPRRAADIKANVERLVAGEPLVHMVR